MKRITSTILLIVSCLCLTSCYVESGYKISKKLNKSVVNLDGNYTISYLKFIDNSKSPTIDLFQKRGSDEFISFGFFLEKNYQPKEKQINVEIKKAVYKLKDYDELFSFMEISNYSYSLYNSIEYDSKKRKLVAIEDKKLLDLIRGYSFYLDFPGPVKARLLEYIEFDLSITDEEGAVHDYHLHYDIKIKTVFKMGSTLWEYWSGI